jgi:hypothetical protein
MVWISSYFGLTRYLMPLPVVTRRVVSVREWSEEREKEREREGERTVLRVNETDGTVYEFKPISG